ncbi:MAG: hypothetical protein EXR70_12520 [Deltaproteobacteria bacterium]|nr:hypothetical protein [Deltaproteobacteria bacterium]
MNALALAVLLNCSALRPLGIRQSSHAQEIRKSPPARRPVASDSELARARTDVIQKIREARAGGQKLLELHDAERLKLAAQYEERRDQYYMGLISREEALRAENAWVEAIIKVDEDKRWLAETDMAMTEYSLRDELLRLPGLAIGGYSESGTLVRFNGGTPWSLIDSPKVEKFFTQAFGRALPISAYGQTTTHDRLRFDHRNAIDVALHPDSKEGRSLLGYLRQAGIPFIAFRNAVAGSATGAHIHIGKPSARN